MMKFMLLRPGVSIIAAWVLLSFGSLSVFSQSSDDAAKGQTHFDSGNSLMAKGDYLGAIQKYSEAMAFLPKWHLPYMNRGIAYLSLMKLAEAEADADKALSLIRPETQSAKLHSATSHQIKGTVRQHLGDYEGALESFSNAVELQPSNPKFYNSRGAAFQMIQRDQDALADYSRAIQLEPKEAQFYVNRAWIYERINNVKAALADLDEALRLNKSLGAAYYTRATIRMRNKSYPEALADYDEAIRLEPNKTTYFHARGLTQIAAKHYEAAVKDFTHAITIDPKNSFAYADRAIANAYQKDLKSAVEDLRSACSIDKDSATLRYNLSYFLYQNGQFSESIQAATEAVSLAPEWTAPYIIRSNSYVKLNMTDKATADRKKATGLGPHGRPKNERYTLFDLEVRLPEEVEQ